MPRRRRGGDTSLDSGAPNFDVSSKSRNLEKCRAAWGDGAVRDLVKSGNVEASRTRTYLETLRREALDWRAAVSARTAPHPGYLLPNNRSTRAAKSEESTDDAAETARPGTPAGIRLPPPSTLRRNVEISKSIELREGMRQYETEVSSRPSSRPDETLGAEISRFRFRRKRNLEISKKTGPSGGRRNYEPSKEASPGMPLDAPVR